MKKITGLALASVAVLALSGCAGEGPDGVVNGIEMAQATNNNGYEQKIYYHCDGGNSGIITYDSTSFIRDIDDTCDFDLHGRSERNPDNAFGKHFVEGKIRLTDEDNRYWDDQKYTCEKPYGTESIRFKTGPNGYIDQASNYYRCTIYFDDSK